MRAPIYSGASAKFMRTVEAIYEQAMLHPNGENVHTFPKGRGSENRHRGTLAPPPPTT